MLRNRKQAQLILKLLLGATRSKEDEYGLSLSTMPFTALKELLDEEKQANIDDKQNLILFFVENRILVLVFTILSSLSHYSHRKSSPHFTRNIVPDTTVINTNAEQSQSSTTEDKNNLYWAKGTGFGTGSTIQQWDSE